ncbi:unnamed protein product [Rotaria sordida]|uniref:Uncharacterized protein n=1 Tax=Rotaria sordida TaxID=392033 RepID=A0A814RN45_9BILA|nr:unnamed protein product [Rotaria sordida]CAF1130380.1 unnamed protein product [Rotaria sordida]CAF1135918.1 unnamed protein product [Rotaria sordida]
MKTVFYIFNRKRKIIVRNDSENENIETNKHNEQQLSDNELDDNQSENDDKYKRKLTLKKNKKCFIYLFLQISHRQSESTGRYKSKATISTEEEEGEEVEDNNEGSAAAEDEQEEGNEENAEDDGQEEEEEEKAPEDIDVSDDED